MNDERMICYYKFYIFIDVNRIWERMANKNSTLRWKLLKEIGKFHFALHKDLVFICIELDGPGNNIFVMIFTAEILQLQKILEFFLFVAN